MRPWPFVCILWGIQPGACWRLLALELLELELHLEHLSPLNFKSTILFRCISWHGGILFDLQWGLVLGLRLCRVRRVSMSRLRLRFWMTFSCSNKPAFWAFKLRISSSFAWNSSVAMAGEGDEQNGTVDGHDCCCCILRPGAFLTVVATLVT